MNYAENIQKVRDIVNKMRYLESLDGILYCGKWFTGPKDGFPYVTKVNAYLSELRQQQLLSREVSQLVAAFDEYAPDQFASDLDRGMVQFLRDRYREAVCIPGEIQAALATANSRGQLAWEECMREDNFEAFKPFLKEQLDVQERIAAAIDPNEEPFQVLVNRWDKGYRLSEIDAIFERLKATIREIMQTRREDAGQDVLALGDNTDLATKKQLIGELQTFLQFPASQSVLYEIRHPVCTCVGPIDSRPALNYTFLFKCLQNGSHEMGHGIYSCNSSEEVAEAGLWGGIEGAMHESQSRFYETQVFFSREFWTGFYPILQKYVPSYKDVPVEQVYEALIRINPQPIRLKADELTNTLHIIIRYELERDYFNGKLRLDDLEEAWNARYQSYLGVTPKSPKEGILQDVHWASGYYGYFQGYVLGDLYASQFRHKLELDCPQAYQNLAAGDMTQINQWLKTHVHQYGQTYSANETLKKATGEALNDAYYIAYMKRKFGA